MALAYAEPRVSVPLKIRIAVAIAVLAFLPVVMLVFLPFAGLVLIAVSSKGRCACDNGSTDGKESNGFDGYLLTSDCMDVKDATGR